MDRKGSPRKEDLTLRHFQQMSLYELQSYLSARSINITGNKKTLAANAYYAHELNIPVNAQNEEEEIAELNKDRKDSKQTF